jgi:YggT family protein
MGGSYLAEAVIFLIDILFGLYLIAVLLRFLLQRVQADYYNPVSQLLVTVTNPALRPLRRVIPGYLGIDWSSILMLLLLQGLEICLIALLRTGYIPALSGLVVMTIAQLLRLTVYLYLILILIQVVLSWVNPGAYNPVTVLIFQLTEPLLRPARRAIPPAGGLDWSPLVVLILLNLILILLVAPLHDWGNHLSGYPVRLL